MSFLSHSEDELKTILATIGIDTPEDVFSPVPGDMRVTKALDIPGPLDEERLRNTLAVSPSPVCFTGGGVYRHHIPACVDALSARQEFSTAYTPYQPEISQGTLQAVFEYQSMLCGLTGMEVTNASLYDGATALAEAALMAVRRKRVKKIAVSRATHPAYRAVLATYLRHLEVEIVEVPFDRETGRTDLAAIEDTLDDSTAFFVQNPNYFGVIEPLDDIAPLAGAAAFWGVVVTEALSLALLRAPGGFGPDVVVGDAQSLGNPASAGGPLLGFMCTTAEYLRHMPGRIVGRTVDQDGNQAFCLTLATREQHIRREKATSNICSNQGLCALRAAIYLSAMGPDGLRNTARQCASGARHLRDLLAEKGHPALLSAPVFHEFVAGMSAEQHGELASRGIVAGIPLKHDYPELGEAVLLTVTEMNTPEDCACLTRAL